LPSVYGRKNRSDLAGAPSLGHGQQENGVLPTIEKSRLSDLAPSGERLSKINPAGQSFERNGVWQTNETPVRTQPRPQAVKPQVLGGARR
jgi:hypothetical protein